MTTRALIHWLETAALNVSEEAAITGDFARQKERYGYLFTDWETNWDVIEGALDNASRLCAMSAVRYAEVPARVVARATEAARRSGQGADTDSIAALITKVESNRLQLDAAWDAFPSLFDSMMLVARGMGVCRTSPLSEQRDWADRCLGRLGELERYFQFVTVRDACDGLGLLSFCERMIHERPPAAQIPHIFRKAFYRRWSEAVAAELPAVHPLTASEHTPRRERYIALDKAQLREAPGRVRERVAQRRNLIFGTDFNVGEMATLNRYLGQTRPRATVRKILSDVPNLLFKLTPCLMMNPLSVSLFLNPDKITFDVVIFDEASQVFPEYALGALLRADQAIIAGDSKQLPPTPFFRRTQDPDSYEDEESDDPREFESVLDAAKVAFGEYGCKTLNWHYRSRHESLIEFSNAEIYTPDNQSLNTFPSVRTPSALSFVHVEDGIYYGGAGAKRDNPIEASEVAKLIIEQVHSGASKTPSQGGRQSIGVITMSGAQEECIRAAIEMHKRYDTLLADVLNEDATDTAEPFFIKSIEDVQGDERDIIFLSIGYGRSADGKLKMLFGPLSRKGGERRLNVAITRAKEKLTVVSSLQPSEINVTEETGLGVRLLRKFIAQAQAAKSTVVAGSDTCTDKFVEAVAMALTDRGHQVRRAVGTSAYRIDLAIEDPGDPEKFLLGIECDSENYRNARTTRARERLRSEVLMGLGWCLLRIWSADWLRDPGVVVAMIEAAMREPMLSAAVTPITPISNDDSVTPGEAPTHDEPLGPDTSQGNPNSADGIKIGESNETGDSLNVILPNSQLLPGLSYFIPYSASLNGGEATLYGTTRDDSLARAEYVLRVIQQEEPVHKELIATRLRLGANLNRAGSQIKRIADDALTVLEQAGKIEQHNDFLRIAGSNISVARVPKPGTVLRSIGHISLDEIAEVALVVIRQAGGVRNEEAVSETARQLGYDRTSTMIRERIQLAVGGLEYENRIHVQGGQIRSLE